MTRRRRVISSSPNLQPDGLLVGAQNGMMAEAIAGIVDPAAPLVFVV